MKNLSIILISTFLVLSFSSCSLLSNHSEIASTTETPISSAITTTDNTELPVYTTESSTTTPVENQPSSFLFDKSTLSPEELDKIIVEQGNRHGLNRFCYDSGWIYGVWFNYDGYSEVVKVRYDGSDWTVLDAPQINSLENCVALHNGYLYFFRSIDDYNNELVRVRVSGNDPEVIIPELSGAPIQISDNYIYYIAKTVFDSNGHLTDTCYSLHRCDLNGENDETIIAQNVYDFTVFGDNILYSDARFSYTISIYNLTTKKTTFISDVRYLSPIYDGEYIYCLTASKTTWNSGSYQIAKLSPDTKTATTVIDSNVSMMMLRGDYIYYINQDDDCRIYRCKKDGSNIELVSQDENVKYMQWINDRIVYVRVDENGACEGIYICGPTGYGKITFEYPEDFWDWIID